MNNTFKTLLEICDENNLRLNENTKWGSMKFYQHPYADLYEKLLKPYHNLNINLLEIGAYYGASAIIWDKYFPKANIIVVDIEERNSIENIKDRVDESRTKIVISDAYSMDFVNSLPMLDVVNDDGPHTLESQIKCIELYYDKLKPGGIIIIEDILLQEYFDIFISKLPENAKYECHNLSSSGVSDSRVFVLWK